MNPETILHRMACIWVVTCLVLTLTGSSFADSDQDVEKYKKMLASESIKVRIDAAKYIVRYRIEDPALFETMKDRLAGGYAQNQTNHHHMDEMAWYCKAIAVSGDDATYGNLLREVTRKTSSMNLKRHCGNSAKQIAVYAKVKEAVDTQTATKSDLTQEEIEYIAMLRSKDPVAMRNVAKKLYRNPSANDVVTDVMGEELLGTCTNYGGDRNMLDALAWMCKALGASGKDKYHATLEQVISKTRSEKLKKYARQGIGLL